MTLRGARRSLQVTAAAGALSLASVVVRAAERAPEGASEESARELFREGNALIEHGRYVDALDRFQEAYALWQNPKIQLNLATTLRALGRNAEALRAYRDYLRDGEPGAERRTEVEDIMHGLETRVGRVQIELGPGVQKVTLDGDVLSDGAETLELDPGRHVLIAETADGARVAAFDVAAGELERVVLAAPDAVSAAPVDEHGSPSEPARPSVIGVLARLEIDGRSEHGVGAVGAFGLIVPFGSQWRASLGGLVGAHHAGGWGGFEWSFFDAALTPTLGASLPIVFARGPRVGASAELGGRWALSDDRLFIALRAALVHFPRPPEGYAQTAVVPSIATELRW